MDEDIHELPGTTFSNSEDRGVYSSEKRATLPLYELERWLTKGVVYYFEYLFVLVKHRQCRGLHQSRRRSRQSGVRQPISPGAGLYDQRPGRARHRLRAHLKLERAQGRPLDYGSVMWRKATECHSGLWSCSKKRIDPCSSKSPSKPAIR